MINMLWSPNTSSMMRSISSIKPYFKPMNLIHIHLIAITLQLNVWLKGTSTFESLGEAIFPNPPSASDSVNSSTIIIPNLEEPLESHITLDHDWDDPLNNFSILHKKTPYTLFLLNHHI